MVFKKNLHSMKQTLYIHKQNKRGTKTMPANRREIIPMENAKTIETIETIERPEPAKTIETIETIERSPTLQEIFRQSIAQFNLQNYNMTIDDFEIEHIPEPHDPAKLPQGKQALYAFFLSDQCLYIGYAGAKSGSRFSSQHYGTSSYGTLARYLLKSGVSDYYGIKDWIRTNCWRINIYTDAAFGTDILKDLRDFLKSEYKPVYGI